ncbi:MAG: TrkA family potassium uptake protein [Candidatus Omnitrophota bacterium]
MYILIAGGGNVGRSLAKKLMAGKHTVVLIEKDKDACIKIARELDTLVINGDACDPKSLEDGGVKRADVVAAVTGQDENNFIICQLAKEVFDVSRTVARVNDSKNARTFSQLEIDVPVDATSILATAIEEEASFEDIVTLMTFKRGKLSIVRVDLTENSPANGKKVMDLQLPQGCVLVSILRGDEVIVPKGDTVLKSRDDIIAIALRENERKFVELLLGDVKA